MSTDPRFDGPGPDVVYALNLADGRFTIQRCGSCGHHQFPPALVCRSCGNASPGFIQASGRGTVYSTTTIRAKEGAHNVSIIELAEGPRLMSTVRGIDPEAVSIGLEVQFSIAEDEQGGEARRYVVFLPVTGEA